jgi:Cation efflux family
MKKRVSHPFRVAFDRSSSYDGLEDDRLADNGFSWTAVGRSGVRGQPGRRVHGLGDVNSRRASGRREPPYGHGKAEYFSSGVEGTLILIAALSIGVAAVDRLISPRPLEEIGVGLAVSIAASLVNFCVAVLLLRAGARETP